MTQKDMQKLRTLFLIILIQSLLMPSSLFGADYDAFILNFLRVSPTAHTIKIDMALGTPKPFTLEKNLTEGQVLRFSIETLLLRERFLRNKNLGTFTKEYYLHYEPLTRQFMVSELITEQNKTTSSSLDDVSLENTSSENTSAENTDISLTNNEQQWNVLLRNTDPHYLLETLVSNIHFQIPVNLEVSQHYILQFQTSIKQAVGKNFAKKNLFFPESDIIEPAQFEYKFDF